MGVAVGSILLLTVDAAANRQRLSVATGAPRQRAWSKYDPPRG
jgi:hypothetical protein